MSALIHKLSLLALGVAVATSIGQPAMANDHDDDKDHHKRSAMEAVAAVALPDSLPVAQKDDHDKDHGESHCDDKDHGDKEGH